MANEVDSGRDAALLSEERLQTLSRNIKTLVPRSSGDGEVENEINSLCTLFRDVFYTSSKGNLPATHKVAAWNVLSGLVDQCLASKSERIRNIVWEQHIWDRCFELYLNQGHDARPKSAKQLLGTLSSALKQATGPLDIPVRISERLLSGLTSQDGQSVKSCLQALAFFLGRDVLSLAAVLKSLDTVETLRTEDETSLPLQRLLFLLFDCGQGDFGAAIGQLLRAILDRAKEDSALSKQSDTPIWLIPLEQVLKHDSVQIDELQNHVLPVLFKRSLTDYVLFLQRHGLSRLTRRSEVENDDHSSPGEGSSQLLLAGLVTGKELGLLYESEGPVISITETSVLLPLRCIARMLHLSDRDTRLTGLSLLIKSLAATKPIPTKSFKILRRCLPSLFADTDANFRGEVISLIQRLMDRIRAATAVLARRPKTDLAAFFALQDHEEFLKWLVRFLKWELRPTASYQRHISALKTLLVVIKSGVDDLVAREHLSKSALNETQWPFSVSFLDHDLRKQLLDLLMDPFDDVRQTSAMILSIYAASCPENESQSARQQLSGVIDQAEEIMLATGRADSADGVAHLYSLLLRLTNHSTPISGRLESPRHVVIAQLVDKLESLLDTAAKSFAVAAHRYPIHGLLTSIRYTLTQDQKAFKFDNFPDRLARCLHAIWEIVKPVLCNDAPEGYTLEDMEDTQEVTTKDTLSYCWRALKESSLLLGVLVNSKVLEQSQTFALADLCFVQLAELRHRGAFSTVAQTWALCCARCNGMEIAGTNASKWWYDKVLDSLRSKTTINTRRSAGLPSLICGLLIVENTGRSTSQAIHDLTEIAHQPVETSTAQESSLPQVHALNCIKDILKNTRLAEHSEQYIAHAFVLAADSLRSQAWAVRNCGLMLFRAAIDRLLGTSESHLEDGPRTRNQISLSKQPEILDAVFALLQPDGNDTDGRGSGYEGVFPALQLLKRVQIPKTKHTEAVRAVEHLTSSRSWHVRDKAARTFATILDEGEVKVALERLLLTNTSDLNGQHGALLCAKYLVARLDLPGTLASCSCPSTMTVNGDDLDVVASDHLLDTLVTAKSMHFDSGIPLIRAAFLDVVLTYCPFKHGKQNPAFNCVSAMGPFKDLQIALVESCQGPGSGYYRRSQAQALAHHLLHDVDTDEEVTIAMVLKLAKSDADACGDFFEEIQHLSLPNVLDHTAIFHLILAISSKILGGAYDVKLKCKIQSYLLSIDTTDPIIVQHSNLLHIFWHAFELTTRPHSIESNHKYADQWLQLEAMKYECMTATDPDRIVGMSEGIAVFVQSCKLAIQQEQNSLFSREAAASALHRADLLWHSIDQALPNVFLDCCIAIYDLLNDDDEDNRQLATSVVSRILETGPNSANGRSVHEPISAQQRLIKFMVRRWWDSPQLAAEAFNRAFGISASGNLLTVAERIAACATTDTTLFVEEKQNLYVDEAREVRLWTQVVGSLSPSAVPRKLLNQLAIWTPKGLDELNLALQRDLDTQVGWTSKLDTFVIGLQVIYGAEALLQLVARGINVPTRPSGLRKRLCMLSLAANSGSANGLWRVEIERVLTGSIISRLPLQKRLLDVIAFGKR